MTNNPSLKRLAAGVLTVSATAGCSQSESVSELKDALANGDQGITSKWVIPDPTQSVLADIQLALNNFEQPEPLSLFSLQPPPKTTEESSPTRDKGCSGVDLKRSNNDLTPRAKAGESTEPLTPLGSEMQRVTGLYRSLHLDIDQIISSTEHELDSVSNSWFPIVEIPLWESQLPEGIKAHLKVLDTNSKRLYLEFLNLPSEHPHALIEIRSGLYETPGITIKVGDPLQRVASYRLTKSELTEVYRLENISEEEVLRILQSSAETLTSIVSQKAQEPIADSVHKIRDLNKRNRLITHHPEIISKMLEGLDVPILEDESEIFRPPTSNRGMRENPLSDRVKLGLLTRELLANLSVSGDNLIAPNTDGWTARKLTHDELGTTKHTIGYEFRQEGHSTPIVAVFSNDVFTVYFGQLPVAGLQFPEGSLPYDSGHCAGNIEALSKILTTLKEITY